MNERTFDVFLRIRHPDLDPEVITRELGLVPEHSWKAGDIRKTTAGASVPNCYPESYWIAPVHFSPELAAGDPERTLVFAAMLLKHRRTVWESIKANGGRAELLLNLSGGNANIDLSSETMSMLDGIGLSISVEMEHEQVAVA